MDQKPPTATIESAHREHLTILPFDDNADFDDADRGLIAAQQPCVVKAADGRVVWDNDVYAFLNGDAPPSVHPSLWRQSTLAVKQGLYEVVEGIYQVRGFDLSNISFIEGDTGVIVIDTLISTETAAAALALYRAHRGDRPVVAVIYTHSHVDHFGGVLGVTSQADVDGGRVAVLAPEGFVAHAVQENVYAGTAMTRRATYMYGTLLAIGPQGQVGCGLGQRTSTGEVAMIMPTIDVQDTGEKHTIDGVEIEFQMAPGTEAPAEMHFYFPRYARCAWPRMPRTTFTTCSPCAARWSVIRMCGRAISPRPSTPSLTGPTSCSPHTTGPPGDMTGSSTSCRCSVICTPFCHDQTLRLLNQGYTGVKIAEQFALPPALEKAWHAHGYYGSVNHNVKAVYQRYMGWFDGNPGRLWPHPPDAIGPRDTSPRWEASTASWNWTASLLATAISASGAGRWDDVISAASEPPRCGARSSRTRWTRLGGAGAENGVWRNFFLSGATELRDGNFGTATSATSPTLLAQLSPRADFRRLRHQHQRPAGLGPRRRRRRHVPRLGSQLPADAAQRRAGLPQGARRRGHRRGDKKSNSQTRCGC